MCERFLYDFVIFFLGKPRKLEQNVVYEKYKTFTKNAILLIKELV